MKATTPDTTKPTPSACQSCAWLCERTFMNSYAVAANMVGIPTRKANSVAAGRNVSPTIMAAKIVAAERDVPGKTAARIWQAPTQKATCQVTTEEDGRPAT